MNFVKKIQSADIQLVGDRVIVFVDGQLKLNLPYEAAEVVARAMLYHVRNAEESDPKIAPKIAFDQAILLRSGAPFGLSSDPKIVNEARKEAVWNSELRKYMPSGNIASRGEFGRPGVIGTSGIPTNEKFGKLGGK